MPSSSTSSSSMQRWLCWMLVSFISGVTIYYAAYQLIDPFGSNSWSLPIARAPLTTDQRYYMPMRARAPDYDSAIIGDSTTLMFNPQVLNPLLEARMVNLSMNGATAYEALHMYRLFLAHRQSPPKYLIYRLSDFDCNLKSSMLTNTAYFPKPLFDDNPFNDWAIAFAPYTLEALYGQLQYAYGLREAGYAPDGYLNPYIGAGSNLQAAEKRILAEAEEMQNRAETSRNQLQPAVYDLKGLTYLRQMLDMTADTTAKIIMLLPREYRTLMPEYGADAKLWNACRLEVIKIIRETPNAIFIDFQFDSQLARLSQGWYDGHHFFLPVAEQIMQAVAKAWHTKSDIENIAKVTAGPSQH